MTLRTGRLTPAASVEVEHNTDIAPPVYPRSTKALSSDSKSMGQAKTQRLMVEPSNTRSEQQLYAVGLTRPSQARVTQGSCSGHH